MAEGREGVRVDSFSERVPEIPPPLSGREPLQVKEMEPEFVQTDSRRGVTYLNAVEREDHRVYAGTDGRLYSTAGTAVDTSNSGTLSGRDGYAIFVMDNQGNLYVSEDHAYNRFHHSSFLSGEPVAGAGEIWVLDGQVIEVTCASGHYRPGPEFHDQVVNELRRQGVDTSAIDGTLPANGS